MIEHEPHVTRLGRVHLAGAIDRGIEQRELLQRALLADEQALATTAILSGDGVDVLVDAGIVASQQTDPVDHARRHVLRRGDDLLRTIGGDLLEPTPVVGPGDAAVMIAVVENAGSAARKQLEQPTLPTAKQVVALPSSETAGEPDVEPLLTEAEDVLGKRDRDRLILLANRILAFSTISDVQAAKAKAYRGMAMCAGHDSDEAARTDLRAIVGVPAQRARLLKFCKREHHLASDQ